MAGHQDIHQAIGSVADGLQQVVLDDGRYDTLNRAYNAVRSAQALLKQIKEQIYVEMAGANCAPAGRPFRNAPKHNYRQK